jgi:hypothetical protein
MNSGDVMKRKTWANRVLQTRGWIIGSAAVLLLLSAGGLMLLAQHAREQANVVTALLALHLASWSYVLGIVCLVLLPVLELIGWFRVRRAARIRYSSVEPRRRDLEKLKMESTQLLQQGVASVVPSRSSRQSDERNKATSSTKVA